MWSAASVEWAEESGHLHVTAVKHLNSEYRNYNKPALSGFLMILSKNPDSG